MYNSMLEFGINIYYFLVLIKILCIIHRFYSDFKKYDKKIK